jgi:hypothetical protein
MGAEICGGAGERYLRHKVAQLRGPPEIDVG